MIRSVLIAASLLALALPALAQDGEARARRILERTPLIDRHNDLPWALRHGFRNDPRAADLRTNLDATTTLQMGGFGSKAAGHLRGGKKTSSQRMSAKVA